MMLNAAEINYMTSNYVYCCSNQQLMVQFSSTFK